MANESDQVFRINVTQEDIDIAMQKHTGNCAIALAFKNAFDDITHMKVDRNQISFSDEYDDHRYVVPTPLSVRTWIDKFDDDKKDVRPFALIIDKRNATDVRERRHLSASKRLQYEKNRTDPNKTPVNPGIRTKRNVNGS